MWEPIAVGSHIYVVETSATFGHMYAMESTAAICQASARESAASAGPPYIITTVLRPASALVPTATVAHCYWRFTYATFAHGSAASTAVEVDIASTTAASSAASTIPSVATATAAS